MAEIENALLRKLNRFYPLGEVETRAVVALKRRRRAVAAGTEVVSERQTEHGVYLLEEGWACAYKMLPEGTRQIIDFALPGDFMGLRSVLLRTSDHSFAAVTDMVVWEIQPGDMVEACRDLPRLGAAVLWAASRSEAMVVEHLVSLGRRDARERTAHLLIELGLRLELVGLDSAVDYRCPLSQYDLADALGLSAIHINRVLRTLREDRLATFRHGRVEIHDPAALRALAGYHEGYLDQHATGDPPAD